MNSQIVEEGLILMKRKRISDIVHGIILPFAIYFMGTLIVSAIFQIVNNYDNVNYILVQGVANVFIFAILCPLYIRMNKKHNIETGQFDILIFMYMIPLAFSICMIGNIVVDYIPRTTENEVTMQVLNLATEHSFILSLIIVSVFIPLVEELLFRGFFYDTIKLFANDIFAIIFTSVAFAIIHMELRQSIYALFAGLFLAYIKYKYKNIIYTIFLHAIMNCMTLVLVGQVLASDDNMYKVFILFLSVAILTMTMFRLKLYKSNN